MKKYMDTFFVGNFILYKKHSYDFSYKFNRERVILSLSTQQKIQNFFKSYEFYFVLI